MSPREWFVRLWGTLRPRRSDRDLEEELRAHLEMAAASGRVRERQVDVVVALEGLRDRRGLSWLRDAAADVRYAARVLRQRPAFAAAALLSIGLGLGASAALFNIGYHLFLRPLPVRAPAELVRLSDGRETVVYTTYERLRRTSQMFAGLTVMTETIPAGTDIEAGGARHRATLQFVSDDFFDVLGIPASRGRVFHQPAPGSPSEPVAVISDDYWQRQYRRDPGAIGAHFTLRGEDITIAGIAPEGFRGASVDTPIDVWMVFDHVIPADSLDRARGRWVQVLGRLRPGASAEQAGLEATGILGRPIQFIPGASGFSSLRAMLFRPLVLLGVVVGLLLVVISANLANLSLAATRARQREFAVRLAIGASRGRLVRQLFTESLVVTAAGVVLALVTAPWIAAALLRYLPASHAAALPNLAFRFDAPLLVAVLALGAAVWSLMSAIPSLGTGWLRPAALKSGGGAGQRAGSWTSRALIVVEVALCTLAIIVAALFVRTLQNLVWQDNGYDADRVLVADVEMPRGYSEAQRDALFYQLRARAQMLPGVRVAAFSQAGQLSGRGIEFHVTVPGAQDAPIDVFEQRVSPDFFEAMGTPLVAGRAVDDRDAANGRHVAVVNEAFVRRFYPGRDPLGQTFTKLGGSRKVDDIEIVGVARDSKWITLREAPRLMFYVPYQQQAGSPAVRMAIRADGDLPALAAQLVREARALDSRMLLTRVQPFHEVVANSVAVERLLAHISGAVGVFTLVIAAVGLYGVLSHAVERRRREIGVRIALGAAPVAVEWMIVREALTLAAIGFALGVPAATLVGGFAASILFGLSPADPTASTFALAVLLLVTVAAAYAPARNAAMTDPMIVLREE